MSDATVNANVVSGQGVTSSVTSQATATGNVTSGGLASGVTSVAGLTGVISTPGLKTALGLPSSTPGSVLCAAPTGVAATDTAAIQAAHDALPAAGGDIQLWGGTYALTAAGVTFTKPQVRLIGVGGWGDAAAFFSTLLYSNAANATALTFNRGGCRVEHLSIANDSGVNATSGYGIKMLDASHARIRDVWVINFYDDIRFEDGYGQWRLVDVYLSAPVRYGFFTANPSQPDIGDGMIRGALFDAQGSSRTSDSVAAIHWESGGGFRCADFKIVSEGTGAGAQFAVGIDFAIADGANTSDLFVQDGSIENCTNVAVRFRRLGTTGSVNLCHVQGIEFLGPTTDSIVDFGPGFDDLRFDGNTIRCDAVTRGVSVRNGAGPVSIGPNTWHGTVVAPVYFEPTALSGSVVDRQTRIGDGALVTDNTAGLNSPAIDYSYQRPINWTVTSTPAALWTLGPASNTGGIVNVTVTGVHNGVGPFVISQKVAWVVDGSGVVTLTTLETIQHGSTTVALTYATGTNSIVPKLAITSGTDIQGGKAQLEVQGKLTTLKVGA